MKKLSQTLVLIVAVLMLTVTFTLADQTGDISGTKLATTPVTNSAQTTPTAKVKKTKAVKKAKPDKNTAAKDIYICPMCQITADKPGKCPMCGMDMVKKEQKGDQKANDEKKM